MKKVILAVVGLLALGFPLLALADAATHSKTASGKKRHSQARHHARKSTAGPKRSRTARQGTAHRSGPRAHRRHNPPTDPTPR